MPETTSEGLKELFEANGAGFKPVSYSNAPFVIRDVYTVSNCRVTAISIPVYKTLSMDDGGNFF